jgi:glutamine synthetase
MDSDTRSIRDWLRQHQISEVECLVPDITGNARGKFIPINQFLSGGESRLPESIMIQSVTGEYSAQHWDFVEPTDADMILKPDASTVRIVPWAREPTAQIIHDCYTMDGVAHPLATRNVLRQVLKRDEFEEFNRVISSWEREHLLLQV